MKSMCLLACLFVVSLASCRQLRGLPAPETVKQFRSQAHDLDIGTTTRISAYSIEEGREFVAAIDEKSILRRFSCNVNVTNSSRIFREGSLRDELLSTNAYVGKYSPDIRARYLFFDKSGKKTLDISVDEDGRRAIVNGRKVLLDGPLGSWMVDEFDYC